MYFWEITTIYSVSKTQLVKRNTVKCTFYFDIPLQYEERYRNDKADCRNGAANVWNNLQGFALHFGYILPRNILQMKEETATKSFCHMLWHSQQTCSPPATSTSTAKLVRWVLWHCTDVTFPTVKLLVMVIPSVIQLPEPILQKQKNQGKKFFYLSSAQL